MNFKNIGLKIQMLLSRMPAKIRKEISRRFEEDNTQFIRKEEDWTNIKSLFCTAMNYRAYDLFTSAINAICLRNVISLNAILRSQFENIILTEFLLKNPEKIKDIFTKKFEFGETIKSTGDRKIVGKIFGLFSEKVHSFPEGLKVAFGSSSMFNYKEMTWEPVVAINSHHTGLDDQLIEDASKATITYFDFIKQNIGKIYALNVYHKLENIKSIHPTGTGRPPPDPQKIIKDLKKQGVEIVK